MKKTQTVRFVSCTAFFITQIVMKSVITYSVITYSGNSVTNLTKHSSMYFIILLDFT